MPPFFNRLKTALLIPFSVRATLIQPTEWQKGFWYDRITDHCCNMGLGFIILVIEYEP